MTTHEHYMQRALDLAAQGLYSASPNPRVGCVLVKNQQIIGEGFHLRAGEPHAEVHALRQAGASAKGATAYVTLEPCSHVGRTPPCALALVEAGVSQVIIALQDPNPKVAGRGIAMLNTAGIQTQVGVLQAQAAALNVGFIKRMQTGRPWVRAKLAMSLDGRTAMASGESQWITGPAARADVQRLRARSCAVVTGADTVILDQARLTLREQELGLSPELTAAALLKPPLRIVVDSRLRVPLDAAFFSAENAVVASTQIPCSPAQASYWQLGTLGQQVDLVALIDKLGQLEANEVLVEAGPKLVGAFLQAGLLDELVVYMAPKLLGNLARPLLNLPLEQMDQAVALAIQEITPVGQDYRIRAYLTAADL